MAEYVAFDAPKLRNDIKSKHFSFRCVSLNVGYGAGWLGHLIRLVEHGANAKIDKDALVDVCFVCGLNMNDYIFTDSKDAIADTVIQKLEDQGYDVDAAYARLCDALSDFAHAVRDALVNCLT